MSASDAQESIRAGGGSLKERMAMLRGSGGFSGPGGAIYLMDFVAITDAS